METANGFVDFPKFLPYFEPVAYKIGAIAVRVDDRGVERSLRRFKRLCDSFGVLREYRKRREYRKPSFRLKEKLAAAEKRRQKTNAQRREGVKI